MIFFNRNYAGTINKRKLKCYCIMLVMCIAWIFYGSPVYSQGKAKKQNPGKVVPVKSHVELSMDTIMIRLDNLHLTLDRINNFSRLNINTRQIEKELPEIQSSLNII